MKKLLCSILCLTLLSITFVSAKEKGYIEHIWDDIILTYDWESITLKDNNINYDKQKCPVWYHIWSAEEWSKVIKLWWDIEWNKYKFSELGKSNDLYKIDEVFKNEERTDEELWILKFWEDILINKWTRIEDHISWIKTSSYWVKHLPYIFIIQELVPEKYDMVHLGKTQWVSFLGLKTCNNIYGRNWNVCWKDFVTRCFKDDENTVINNWFSKEYNDAYVFAYNNKITTMPSIEEANMNWEIIRAEIAKMLANWVKSFGYYADSKIPCNFTDTSSVKWDLATAIIESCQYWIMWQWITQFRPYDKITKAEVATAVSRILWWAQYDWWTPFYINHVYALENAWVLTDSSNINSNELRWNVMALLMRANNILKNTSADCDDPQIAIACASWDSNCPAKCK